MHIGPNIGVTMQQRTAEASPSYVGPLDLVPGLWAFSMVRAMAASKLGESAFTIEDSVVGPPQQVVSYGEVNGLVDAAAVLTFLGGNPGWVEVVDDNVASADLTEEGGILWSADVGNGHPGLVPSVGNNIYGTGCVVPSGARHIAFVLDADEFADYIFHIRDGDNVDLAQFKVGIGWDNPDQLFVEMNGAEGGAYTVWLAGVGIPLNEACLIVLSVAANGTVSATGNGVDLEMTKDSGELVPPPGIANARIDVKISEALNSYQEVALWGDVNIAPAIAEMEAFYDL